ncbi:MAG: imidazoleglycerol-phosphate dehydratase/histidinol-phosphatase [Pseudohongiellaceae bacterium]|jgi:imidazoleglycerol-phosphate dehydratase/histidinol-phosphatase
MTRAILFIDRDGTLIEEPDGGRVDSLEKLTLVRDVIPSLLRLKRHGYIFVVVTNQDGLGSPRYPKSVFRPVQQKFLELFASQGVVFDDVLVCPHTVEDRCTCRIPHLGLLSPYLARVDVDTARSAVVGDRSSDMDLARNMGVRGLLLARNCDFTISDTEAITWQGVADTLIALPRVGRVERTTSQTSVIASVDLDGSGASRITTGLGIFDHMLEQLARHGGFDLDVAMAGNLHVDEHHTVEDTAIALGEALDEALGDRYGIGRYGFVLPTDEALAQVAIDLSGRGQLVFAGSFPRERVGELPTELISHFFRSFADALGATMHITVTGSNSHHMIEAVFKAVARALRPALARDAANTHVASSKGLL